MQAQVEIIESRLFDGTVADELVACINECVQESDRCSLVLAGGSSPGGVYRALVKPPRVSEVPWNKISMFIGDERWVPQTDDQNNFKMIEETLLAQLPASNRPASFPVDTTLKTPAEGAAAYQTSIAKSFNLKPNEIPTFDIVILGMGEDGHTASLFPGEANVLSESGVVAAAINPHNNTERVTLLPKALFSARKIFYIVKGESKAVTLQRVLEGAEEPSVLPARLYTKATGRVTFFVDSAAAKSLTKRV